MTEAKKAIIVACKSEDTILNLKKVLIEHYLYNPLNTKAFNAVLNKILFNICMDYGLVNTLDVISEMNPDSMYYDTELSYNDNILNLLIRKIQHSDVIKFHDITFK